MIKLFKETEGRYRVVSRDKSIDISGDYLDASTELYCLGIDTDEINTAFKELEDKNHNEADFGVNGMLTYTKLSGAFYVH